MGDRVSENQRERVGTEGSAGVRQSGFGPSGSVPLVRSQQTMELQCRGRENIHLGLPGKKRRGEVVTIRDSHYEVGTDVARHGPVPKLLGPALCTKDGVDDLGDAVVKSGDQGRRFSMDDLNLVFICWPLGGGFRAFREKDKCCITWPGVSSLQENRT